MRFNPGDKVRIVSIGGYNTVEQHNAIGSVGVVSNRPSTAHYPLQVKITEVGEGGDKAWIGATIPIAPGEIEPFTEKVPTARPDDVLQKYAKEIDKVFGAGDTTVEYLSALGLLTHFAIEWEQAHGR